MISIPTVLILGAGASNDYGFPCGEVLKQLILSGLGSAVQHSQFPSNADGRILHELGFTQTEIRDFVNAFNFSGTVSIDAFLEHRSDLIKLGKTAIALFLCPFEHVDELFRKVEGRQDWYRYLYDRMKTAFDDFGTNKLSVVTYNYDRSFESYLFTALQNGFGRSEREVASVLEKIPVVHLHGQLGTPPWQGLADSRPYEPHKTSPEIKLASDGIRIIHEPDLAGDPSFTRAEQLIEAAQRVIFLGFGYDQTNLKRIVKFFKPGQELLGTFFGLSQIECNTIKAQISIKDPRPKYKSLGLLRERISL
jgi:hypothetical protein